MTKITQEINQFHPTDTIHLRADTKINLAFLESLCGELLLGKNSRLHIVVQYLLAQPLETAVLHDNEPLMIAILEAWTNNNRIDTQTQFTYTWFWKIYIFPFIDYLTICKQQINDISQKYILNQISETEKLALIQKEFIDIFVQLNSCNITRPFVHKI